MKLSSKPSPNAHIMSEAVICGHRSGFLLWKFHKLGKLTVITAYAMLITDDMDHIMDDPARDFYKTLWSMKILPKWKLFIWKLLHKGIASKSILIIEVFMFLFVAICAIIWRKIPTSVFAVLLDNLGGV